jgi:hypothetical protein
VPELGTLGSVRGVASNGHPYRDKDPNWGADAVHPAEGNTAARVIREWAPTLRGPRPWHVQKLLARKPGDLVVGRGACRRSVSGRRRAVADDERP